MSRVDGNITPGAIYFQLSQGTVVPAEGRQFEAEVVFQRDPSNPISIKKGILIDGKFVEIALPPEVKEGDRIKLQVVQVGKDFALKYIETLPDRAASPELERVRKEIASLLKDISLSKESLGLLRLLIDPDAAQEPLEIKVPVRQKPDAASEKLLKILIQEESLEDPKLLEEKLRGLDFRSVVKLVRQLTEESAAANPFSRPELNRARDDLLRNLVSLLKELDPQKLDTAGAVRPAGKPNEAQIPASSGSVQRALNKLLDVLSEIGVKGSDLLIEGERKLREIFNQQSEILKSFESRVKKLLVSPSYESALDTLIKTVDSIDLSKIDGNDPSQVKFKEFIINLQNELKLLTQSSASEEQIKKTLESFLKQLYIDFQIPELRFRVYTASKADMQAVFENLSKEQRIVLKNVEAQLQNIISSPPGSLVQYGDSKDGGNSYPVTISSGALRNIIRNLKDLSSGPEPIGERLKELAASFEENIDKLLKSDRPLSQIDKELRLISGSLLKDLTRIGLVQNKTDPEMTIPAYTAPLQQIEALLREIIDDAQTLVERPSTVVKLSKFQELISALKRIESIIPDPANNLEQEFVEFAEALLEKIETESKRSSPALADTLKRGIEQIHSKFVRAASISSGELFAAVNQKALASIESMVQGQEIISKLTPLMQALGEPALAIFPCLIQGFLSKIEIQAKPFRPDDSEKDKKEGNRGGGEGFEQVSLRMPFPGMGMVHVGIAHRSSQILISFSFESKNAAEFVGAHIPKLEFVLKNSGFDEVEINCIGGAKPENSEDWFEKLLSGRGVIA